MNQNIVTLADIEAAELQFPAGYIAPVDVTLCEALGNAIGANLYVIRADMGDVLSFKERGSFVKIAQEVANALSDGRNNLHFVAASEGNHSQGVAKATAYFAEIYPEMDIQATIIMPELTSQVKRDRTISVGNGCTQIQLIKQNPTYGDASGLYDDALALAKKMQAKSGYILVPTFDGKEIIAGQGTVALEIKRLGIDFDAIYQASGGAGLVAGVAAGFSGTNTKIVGVQPAWVPSAVVSMAMGKAARIPAISGAQKISIGGKALAHEIHPDGVIIAEAGQVPTDNLLHYGASIETVTPEQAAFGYAHFLKAVCRNNKGKIAFSDAPEVCATLGLAHVLRESIKNPGCFRGQNIAVIVSGRNVSRVDAMSAFDAGKIISSYTRKNTDAVAEIFYPETPAYRPSKYADFAALKSLEGNVPDDFLRNLTSRALAS